ncbi:MAG: hypothetical protein AAGM04_07720 [Pseudomonadota bacterium]
MMKLLHGDGIFVADPIRAVIVNGNGKLLAASPMSLTLSISCNRAKGRKECIAYDELRQIIYTPNRSNWKANKTLELAGIPQEYPEYRMDEYGFEKRKASFFEIAKFEIRSIFESPMPTVLAIVWWAAIWMLITPIYWWLKSNIWQIEKVSLISVLLFAARLIGISTLLLASAYAWFLFPYSLPYFIFVSLAGAGFALTLTKPKPMN